MPAILTFDWNKHWEITHEPEPAQRFAVKMAGMLGNFIQTKHITTIADYGCGPATTIFTLASRFPKIKFYGFDVATSIIQQNIKRAKQIRLKNLSFAQDCLPYPQQRSQYDLIVCFATLHYIEEIERAILHLFKLVKSEGSLIFNYPNVYSRMAYQRDISPNDENMKQRFALILAGENLISQKKIKNLVGIRPQKFYSSNRSNIYVVLSKLRKIRMF